MTGSRCDLEPGDPPGPNESVKGKQRIDQWSIRCGPSIAKQFFEGSFERFLFEPPNDHVMEVQQPAVKMNDETFRFR